MGRGGDSGRWYRASVSALRRLLERRAAPLPKRVQAAVVLGTVVLLAGAAVWAWRSADLTLAAVEWWPIAVAFFVVSPITLGAKMLEYDAAGRIVGARAPWRRAFDISIVSAAANLLPIPGSVLVTTRATVIRLEQEKTELERKVAAVARGAGEVELAALDHEFATRRADLIDAWRAIESANEPTVLSGGDFTRIGEIAKRVSLDLRGSERPLLTPPETTCLTIMRGSLTKEEIEEIRSHAMHTWSFLAQIPWGKTFRRVPVIAGAHHEKLNGTGYPRGLRAEEIPLQSKMMSISDIFDALTASDRPYKRAVPIDKALDILGFEVKDGHLDGDLVRIFAEAKCWEGVVGRV